MVFYHNNGKFWLKQESLASTCLLFLNVCNSLFLFFFSFLSFPLKNVQGKGQRGIRSNVVRIFFLWESCLPTTEYSCLEDRAPQQTSNCCLCFHRKGCQYFGDLVIYVIYSSSFSESNRHCKWLSLALPSLICMIIFGGGSDGQSFPFAKIT